MKRTVVLTAIFCIILWAQIASAEDYRVIQKMSVPADVDFLEGITLSPDGSKLTFRTNTGGIKDQYGSLKGGKWYVWINDKKVYHPRSIL